MTVLTQHIVSLSETLASHQGVSHWAVSSQVSSKGDLIHRLMNDGDVNTRTYETVMKRFDAIWPADLAWPADVPRPSSKGKAA
ncbi:hypothetical protein [Loktanella sp. 3ANDIMAR09]|uniref:hypothetical protein n=1 Tax=Loktanella sp. 3ANDIMAR09 TaxID=1225657 RepID=UPI000AA031B7|nr:hypothetical protein [Loktanella sp. 3ANDIMAR09]